MISAERTHLHVATATHPGMKGKQNEDRYAVSAHLLDAPFPGPSTFAVVSDGIGGHRAGEVAAEMAVEVISRAIVESDPSHPQESLRDAVVSASRAIREQAMANPAQQGMGATCACAWVIGDRLYIASVGDSRIYLVRDETIRQLTTDHTWIQEAIERGLLDPEAASGHPNQHVIRRFLGSDPLPVPDMRLRLKQEENDEQAVNNQGAPLFPGDCLLLCSDGLTDLVEDWEILARLLNPDLEDALNGLVELANQRGGHDNITMIALRVPEVYPAQPSVSPTDETVRVVLDKPRQRAFPARPVFLSCLGLSALLVVGLLAVAAYGWYLDRLDPTPTTLPALSTSPTAAAPELVQTPLSTPTTVPALATPTSPAVPRPTYTAWPTSTPLSLPIVPFLTPQASPTPPGP